MTKGTRGRRKKASRRCRETPVPVPSNLSDPNEKNSTIPKKEWEDITCSVCMEPPHNAVLLLCSSHDKGCRSYMCGTSSRYSNCLDQYQKAYTKVTSPDHTQPLTGSDSSPVLEPLSGLPVEKNGEAAELACPLCRGQVKGWTVVESAREYLNSKKRTCMHDNCSFIGAYTELKKHVKSEHHCAKPREVDPDQEQKWTQLVRERERDDVISTITSSIPGSMVFGDYVIDRNPYESDSEDEDGFDVDALARINNGNLDMETGNSLINVFHMFHEFATSGNGGRRDDGDSGDGNANNGGGGGGGGRSMSLVDHFFSQSRAILGRPGRRRQNREVNGRQT